MQYFISFLEGIITFISPCLLPMLPMYIFYFAGGDKNDTKKTVKNALGFILGFTSVFVLMGALAGSFGRLLNEYKTAVNIVTGIIVIFFGLNFLGVFKINIFKGTRIAKREELGFVSAFTSLIIILNIYGLEHKILVLTVILSTSLIFCSKYKFNSFTKLK